MSYNEIWSKLSKIDCSEYIEKKNGLNFLSWAWAWGILMEHYADAAFTFAPEETFPDGTVMVSCSVTIGECSRSMWLPVMDHRNRAIQHPDSFARNTARMRCLVKTLALYGLGHYIYAGEDLPVVEAPLITDAQQSELAAMIDELGERMDFTMFLKFFKISGLNEMKASDFPKAKAALEKRMGA